MQKTNCDRQDTKNTKGANEKAKANTITAIGELIEIAYNKAEYPDYFNKHGSKAKYGWYRYDTRFGLPVYDENGEFIDVHSKKLEALEDLIESANGKPVLVAYWFKHDLERIEKHLKKETSKPH